METYRRAQPIGGPQLQLPPSVWDRATGCNYNLSGIHNGTLLLLQHTYNHRTPGPVERSRPNAEDFAARSLGRWRAEELRRTAQVHAGGHVACCALLAAALLSLRAARMATLPFPPPPPPSPPPTPTCQPLPTAAAIPSFPPFTPLPSPPPSPPSSPTRPESPSGANRLRSTASSRIEYRLGASFRHAHPPRSSCISSMDAAVSL